MQIGGLANNVKQGSSVEKVNIKAVKRNIRQGMPHVGPKGYDDYYYYEEGRADEEIQELLAPYLEQTKAQLEAKAIETAGELGKWLRDVTKAEGNHELALQAAQEAVTSSHKLADYTAVERLAGESWTTLKEPLLQKIESDNYSLVQHIPA